MNYSAFARGHGIQAERLFGFRGRVGRQLLRRALVRRCAANGNRRNRSGRDRRMAAQGAASARRYIREREEVRRRARAILLYLGRRRLRQFLGAQIRRACPRMRRRGAAAAAEEFPPRMACRADILGDVAVAICISVARHSAGGGRKRFHINCVSEI